MIKIAPSILAADFANLGAAVQAAEAGGADYIHVDVMDGNFVPNLTVGPPVVAAVRKVTRLPLDVHLMIERPERYLADFVKAGADLLTVHVETCPHLYCTVQQIRELEIKAGVTLNPGTSLETVREVLPFVDQVLVMTVNPGLGGQKFIEATLKKIARVRRMFDEGGLERDIEVDGGIGQATAPLVVKAGANLLVAGASVFAARDGVAAAIQRLRASLNLI